MKFFENKHIFCKNTLVWLHNILGHLLDDFRWFQKKLMLFLKTFFGSKLKKSEKFIIFSCFFWVDLLSSLREAFSEQYAKKYINVKVSFWLIIHEKKSFLKKVFFHKVWDHLRSRCLLLLYSTSVWWIFAIFKMHLRVSALAISRETLLSDTTAGYYKLVEYQLPYSFLHHLPWPANMVENPKFTSLWDRWIFCNFQNACPRNCSGHFPRYSTQLHYSRILQTGRVSASVLTHTPLDMTCKHVH